MPTVLLIQGWRVFFHSHFDLIAEAWHEHFGV